MPNCTLTVNSGATATFMGHIKIMDRAVLIVNGATLQMYQGTRIIINGYHGAGVFYNRMGGYMYVTNSTIKSTGTSTFWSGIETMRGALSNPFVNTDMKKEGVVHIEYSTVENAENALRNYNKDFIANQTCGGAITASITNFKNNKRSILLHNENRSANTSNPYVVDGMNWNALFQRCNFIYTPTFPTSALSQEIVRLTNCKNVTFLSCNFQNQGVASISQNCAAIRGFSSSVLVQPYFIGSAPRCKFEFLESGIVLSNSLETNRVSVILNSDFQCKNNINLSGCFNPLIGTNIFLIGYNNPDVGIYLNNSTGYKVEGNVLKGHPMGGVGIVVKNSGVANNEIYRNSSPGYPMGLKVGIQSIDWNRNASGISGLKILCNTLAQFHTSYDISIMKDPNVIYLPSPPPFGVANNQYVQGGLFSPNRAAGNVFYQQDGANNNNDYFLQSGTNNINQFQYRYNSGNLLEYPSSSNIGPNISSALINSCPSKNTTGIPPLFPYMSFLSQLTSIESQIGNIEIKINRNEKDTFELDRLYTAQAELIDSSVSYYQYADYQDSAALVYEQVTKGYQYKLYLAATYLGLGRHDDAIDLLLSLNELYSLSDIEAQETEHLAIIYASLKWLYLNEDNWEEMPEELKSPVYEYEVADPTSAGAVARSLLARFEDRRYDPMYILPPEDAEIMMYKTAIAKGVRVYPNPTKNKFLLDWDGDNGIITVTDIVGKVLIQQSTDGKYNEVTTNTLAPGLYILTVKVGGKVMYQQKIVKQ